MRRWSIHTILCLLLTFSVTAQPRPKLYFPSLTQAMGLAIPELKGNDCEVRVWQKCQLCFGEAHVLYQLTKTNEKVSLNKYAMHFKKHKFVRATKTELKDETANELWQRVVQQGILTLPDEAAIANELHPRQQRDSTWHTIDSIGIFSVHAKKMKQSIWISDGESYHFEIFSTNGYRAYTYSNPYGYIKHKPDVAELRKVVSILDGLSGAF